MQDLVGLATTLSLSVVYLRDEWEGESGVSRLALGFVFFEEKTES